MAAPSQTGIVNRALALLGSAARIAQIDDGSATASCAGALWDGVVDATLAAHPWAFATKRARLPADADAPEFGYQRQFALPTDCLRWLPPRDAHDDDGFSGVQEGQYILTDALAPLPIRYIFRELNMLAWTPGFLDALVARLAWEMAEPITGGLEGVVDRMWKKFDDAIEAAKLQSALARGTGGRVVHHSDWLGSRGREGRGHYR